MAIYKSLVNKIKIPAENKIKQKDYLPSGILPIIDQGRESVGGYTNDTSKQIICDLPVIVFGDHTKNVKYVNFPFCAGADGIKVLKANEGICEKYLYYGTIYLTYRIENKGYARHYQHIEKSDLPVPSLPEQERIVAKIEELFSQLDAAVAELNTIREKLQIYRQAVLKEAFEEEIEKYHYFSLPLKNLVVEKGGLRRGPFGGAIKKSCFVPSGYKVYEQGNSINDSVDYGKYFISREKYEEMHNFQVVPHDLIVSCSGTLGRIAEIPDNAPAGIINQALLRIRLNRNIVLNEYFVEYFRAAFFQRKIIAKSQGSAMQNLVSIKDFKEIKLNIPSTDVQKRLIESLSKKISQCDIMVRFIDESLLRAAALRQSILKQAFIGDL